MYTHKNYKTKKALKDDLNAGAKISVYQPGGIFPGETDGWITLEGPHYPEPHRWYASALIKDSVIQKLRNPSTNPLVTGEPLTKSQMITEIMNAYKAGCLSNKNIKYREQMKLDETWLALAFRTDQELRNICHELGIKTKNPVKAKARNPIPGEEMHYSTVPAFQMSQSVGQREMKSVWHKGGDYWIGGYSRWGLKTFAVLGKKREKYFRVRDIKGMEKWVAKFFQDPSILFVDAFSPRMFRRYFPNHRWINVNNTKTGGKW